MGETTDPSSSSKRAPSDESSNSKRSRGLGLVTPNACTECRKKRAKCDGSKPCGRCKSQNGIECVYEVPVRQSKENMRTEIQQLRKHQRQTESILGALTSRERGDIVLEQIRKGDTLENICDLVDRSAQSGSPEDAPATTYARYSDEQAIGLALNPAQSVVHKPYPTQNINDPYSGGNQFQLTRPVFSQNRRGQSSLSNNSLYSGGDSSNAAASGSQYDDVMSWESDSTPNGPYDATPLGAATHDKSSSQSSPDNKILEARHQGQETILTYQANCEGESVANIKSVAPWTAVTSDTGFVEHLMTLYFCWEYPTFASLSKEHFLKDFRNGKPNNCSSLLVNAILALGCRFSTQPNARADPNDKNTAGDHFFAEAQRILDEQDDHHSLTTIQAIGLMSLREASCGRSSESIFLSGQSIRLAIEMGLHFEHVQDKNGEGTEAEKAVRGATFWGAFSLDQAWSLSVGMLPRFSRDLKLVKKPSVIDEVERSPWVPYTDDGAPIERNCTQPSNVRSVFETFCELSEIVHRHLYAFHTPGRRIHSKTLLDIYTQYLNWYEAIPSALRLGQNFTPAVLFAHMYYHYAILLLFRPFIKLKLIGSGVSPRDVCNQAGEAISALVNSYSQLYTLRRTPSFVPYFVLTSSITHLVTLGNTDAEPDKLLSSFRYLKEMTLCHGFANRGLDIVRYLSDYWQVDVKLGSLIEDDKDSNDLCRADTMSTNEYCPNMEGFDIMKGIQNPESEDDNPLFWAFPMQGRPMIALGPSLAEAGFAVL